MRKCPKCGYRERFDWPTILRALIFYGLSFGLVFGAPKRYRLVAWVAILLFSLPWGRGGRNLDSKLVRLFGDGNNLSPKPPANG
jgi:hypothetical protein